jgi:hypothetical protein
MLNLTKTNINYNQKLYLDKDHKSWVQLRFIGDDLLKYTNDNFNNMIELVKTENKSNVLVFNKDTNNPNWIEQECHRWHKSYLNTPSFDKSVHKSYMFSGNDGSEVCLDIP